MNLPTQIKTLSELDGAMISEAMYVSVNGDQYIVLKVSGDRFAIFSQVKSDSVFDMMFSCKTDVFRQTLAAREMVSFKMITEEQFTRWSTDHDTLARRARYDVLKSEMADLEEEFGGRS